MASDWTRRAFVGAASAAAVGMIGATAQAAEPKTVKIIGVSCSPRKGMTTATAVNACLEAAKAVGPNVEVELIDLGGMKIPGEVAAGVKLAEGERDDFPALAEKLKDPKVAGIIIGTPVYFGQMSALCKAFLDRWMAFRKDNVMSNRVAGCLAVGAGRNGGQELTIASLQAILMAQEMVVVGDARPTQHRGAILWNNWKDDITKDEFGMQTAKNLGKRVAEVAMKMVG